MVAEKPVRALDTAEAKYDRHHWELLDRLRSQAMVIMELLEEKNLPCLVHGSLARGDVTPRSDVDIIVPAHVPTQTVETIIGLKGYQVYSRALVQATPSHSPKAHFYLGQGDRICVTVPLLPLRKLELEFYKFGGMIDSRGLRRGERVAGCTKRLTLIEPTASGHMESPVMGREEQVAKVLGVSPEIVKERVRVLTRRDAVGRTGVFLKSLLAPNETFEERLKWLTDRNPAIRRLMAERT